MKKQQSQRLAPQRKPPSMAGLRVVGGDGSERREAPLAEQLVQGARADLDAEAERLQRIAEQRRAVIEAARREQTGREARRSQRLAQQQPEVTFGPVRVVGRPGGWERLTRTSQANLAREAAQTRHEAAQVPGIDPDDLQHENARLGTPGAGVVAKERP
jgi:hypothetical protein